MVEMFVENVGGIKGEVWGLGVNEFMVNEFMVYEFMVYVVTLL
jgi:hypothetical protein